MHLFAGKCKSVVPLAGMFVVAFIALKGGVGKTTLTLSIATLAELDGHTVAVVDCDSSRSATKWQQSRAKLLGKQSPPVAAVDDVATFERAIKAARADRIDWLFVDTAAGVSELATAAAERADLVLMPCTPSRLDMEGMAATAKLMRRIGRPAFFVVNKGRNSRAMNDACALALTSVYGLPAAAAHVQLRVPMADIVDTGATLPEAVGKDPSTVKGQEELRALWQWLSEQRDGDGQTEGKKRKTAHG